MEHRERNLSLRCFFRLVGDIETVSVFSIFMEGRKWKMRRPSKSFFRLGGDFKQSLRRFTYGSSITPAQWDWK